MEIVPFIAESAADAARQVRERLGPEAVVVQVRPIGGGNKGWFGKKEQPRFEVLAYRPNPAAPHPASGPPPHPEPRPRLDVLAGDPPNDPIRPGVSPREGPATYSGFPGRTPAAPTSSSSSTPSAPDAPPAAPAVADLGPDTSPAIPTLQGRGSTVAEFPMAQANPAAAQANAPATLNAVPQGQPRQATHSQAQTSAEPAGGSPASSSSAGGWRAGAILESAGFLPREAQWVIDRLRRGVGDQPPAGLGDELRLVRRELARAWRPAVPLNPDGGETHVLVGAPGVGKTTCLCKWLTQMALGEGRPVRIWRLDGTTANTAEALAVYCDVLGVPLARRWSEGDGAEPGEFGFVDLPGIDWRDATALKAAAEQIAGLGRVRLHLVLNGAYDISLMLAQVRAFAGLGIEDLIVTHLDEETRWGKLWNLVLGTNFTLRFLAAGQNVPGEFRVGTAEALMMRQFPH
jgi:flagellar biosynthesis GTPase FlhF